jgi:hypothetical protein
MGLIRAESAAFPSASERIWQLSTHKRPDVARLGKLFVYSKVYAATIGIYGLTMYCHLVKTNDERSAQCEAAATIMVATPQPMPLPNASAAAAVTPAC